MFEYTSHIATTTEVLTAVSSDIVTTIAVVIGLVAGVAVLILGIRWGFRRLRGGMNGRL